MGPKVVPSVENSFLHFALLYLDTKTALNLYNALIMPIIDYCDIIYSTGCSKYLRKVERLMLKGGKIVLNVPFDTPGTDVLHKLKWLTLKERTDYHKCIQMFKCMNDMSPNYLSSLFKNVDHGYQTRQSSHLKVKKCKTAMGQRSFVYCGANVWNSLPLDIRSLSCIEVFKSHLLKHILNMRN